MKKTWTDKDDKLLIRQHRELLCIKNDEGKKEKINQMCSMFDCNEFYIEKRIEFLYALDSINRKKGKHESKKNK